MALQNGMPSAAALQTTMDAMAAWYKRVVSPLGTGAAGETTTLAALADTGMAQILGDNGANPGIDNPGIKAALEPRLANWRSSSRYDVYGGQQMRSLIDALEQQLRQVLPKYIDSNGNLAAWNFSGGGVRMLDAMLIRLNGTHPSTPAKPTGTPALTAITGGALPSVASGSAPRVAYAFVGQYDYLESQPSAECAQVALTGNKSGYTLGTIQTPIPAGVYKIRVLRGVVGGGAGVYYWLKDVAVNPGDAAPTISITEPDALLRQDITKVVFGSVLSLPEFALAFACAYATLLINSATGLGQPSFGSNGLLSPSNVALGLASGLLGPSNSPVSAMLGQWTGGTGAIPSSMQAANSTSLGLQGFEGAAGGVQARVTAVLDANASLTNIGYTYVDAAHPTTTQSDTIAGPLTLNLAVDQTVDLGITAGRIVKSITGVTVGAATTGTFIFEGKALRAI